MVSLPPQPVSPPWRIMHLGPSLTQQGGMATVQILLMGMVVPGFDLFHIATHDEGSKGHRLRVFAQALGRCIQALQGDPQVKIAHIHMSERGSVARVLILVTLIAGYRKPTILHTHGAEFKEFYGGQPRWIQNVIGAVLRRCDRIIALSASWGDYYAQTLNIPRDRVQVLHNPVSIPEVPPKAPRPKDHPFHFVFLGRIGERKGAFRLLQAFAQLHHTSPAPVYLTLAGDGEIIAAQSLATELGISAQVHFPGWLGLEARTALLANADAFILPSLNEGLPMAILEAMSWQLPIIASAVGGIPEVVIPLQTGLLIDPQSTDSIAQAMTTLVNDPALAQTLGIAARTQIRKFSIANYQEKLRQLYRDLTK